MVCLVVQQVADVTGELGELLKLLDDAAPFLEGGGDGVCDGVDSCDDDGLDRTDFFRVDLDSRGSSSLSSS